MFNVLKNTSLFKNDNYRLVSINNNYDNRLLLFILLSIYKKDLSNYKTDELNEITNNLKSKLNKYSKKKYKINYLNYNSNKHLNILSKLFEININIFNKNLDSIKFKSDTNFNKSLNLLYKNKSLYLISMKNNDGLIYQFQKELQIGGVRQEQMIPDKNIGLWNPQKFKKITPNPDVKLLQNTYYDKEKNWYSLEQVNNFLITQCSKSINSKKVGEQMKAIQQIHVATFTNIFRVDIYTTIHNINIGLEEFINNLSQGPHNYLEISSAKLIISGGDCFNLLLNSKTNRPISPDIDVKLVIESPSANRLHNNNSKTNYINSRERKTNIQLFNISLLLVRNKLYELLDEEVISLNNLISEYNSRFIDTYSNLCEYCKKLMNTENIPTLDFKNGKPIKVFQKRFNHMESGYSQKAGAKLNDPFTTTNVLLYSIDGIFEGKNENSHNGINGILDIVLSLPTHSGYMINDEYDKLEYNKNITELYIMNKNYYINNDNLKMVTYGLRTANKKIIKDFRRILIMIIEDYGNKIINKREIIRYIIDTIGELKVLDIYKQNIDELDEILNFITNCLNMSGSGINSNNNSNNKYICKRLPISNNHFESDENNNSYQEEEQEEEPIEPSFFERFKALFGGSVINIQQTVVSYKLPKSLYFIIPESIIEFSEDSSLMAPIKNINEQTEQLKNQIVNINYEKLTELTTGNPDLRSQNLNNQNNIVLNEAFNSKNLTRFNNKKFGRWNIPKNIKQINDMLNKVNKKILENTNNIQKLYYFNLNLSNNQDYNSLINTEVAKCLMHSFMHCFNPEYIITDNKYYKLLDFTPTENNPYPSIENVNKSQSIKELLKFFNIIKNISDNIDINTISDTTSNNPQYELRPSNNNSNMKQGKSKRSKVKP